MAGSIKLSAPTGPLKSTVNLPISKSIANRLLILGALSGTSVEIEDQALPDDVKLMKDALSSSGNIKDLQNAGTAMRFLTAYFAIQEGKEVILNGNEAMNQRPIGNLVDALRSLGADISYESKEGFPPLRINGKTLDGETVELNASVSSQFISALMLIGSFLKNGLEIKVKGESVSSSYLRLTAALINQVGGAVEVSNSSIHIRRSSIANCQLPIESDWSAASYFYAMAALRSKSKLLLKGLKLDSSQGDRRIAEIMAAFGVRSKQTEEGVEINSKETQPSGKFSYDLNSEPDIMQTLACFHAARGDEVTYSGIDHLRFKETNRLAALQEELKKFNVQFAKAENGWSQSGQASWNGEPISTYGDHRMAMAFSILSIQFEGLKIEDPKVVSKSFPKFWEALGRIGITLEP